MTRPIATVIGPRVSKKNVAIYTLFLLVLLCCCSCQTPEPPIEEPQLDFDLRLDGQAVVGKKLEIERMSDSLLELHVRNLKLQEGQSRYQVFLTTEGGGERYGREQMGESAPEPVMIATGSSAESNITLNLESQRPYGHAFYEFRVRDVFANRTKEREYFFNVDFREGNQAPVSAPSPAISVEP